MVLFRSKWKVHQNAVYWGQPIGSSEGGIGILPDTVLLQSSFMTLSLQTALKKWWMWNPRKIMHESACLSPRPPPKIVVKTAWQDRHEDHQHAEILTSNMENPVAIMILGKIDVETEYGETRGGHEDTHSKVDYRIPRNTPRSSQTGRRCSKTINQQTGLPDTESSKQGCTYRRCAAESAL